jgi:FAD/FMN-containing dehydrogenase/short-subunit dehydrogenase
MKKTREEVANWGLYPKTESVVIYPETVQEIKELVTSGQPVIARGNGRCYGDASLSNYIVSTTRLNKIIDFDTATGVIRCEAGVLLDQILELCVPKGFFLPVTPGTKFITVGGALASDIHGKNHHIDGVFSDHVTYFNLVDAGGNLINITPDNELFIQTAGGMGRTGIITELGLRLKPIETSFIRQRAIRAKNLNEIFRLFEENQDTTYSVAWIDCLAKGEQLGRSVLLLGEHAESQEIKDSKALQIHRAPGLKVPFMFPKWVLNPLFIKIFNALYYNKPSSSGNAIVHYDPYFYPLDKIHHWNRIYGKNGFIQYQFVLPKEVSFEGVKKVLEILSEHKLGSFLAVLKLFGTSHEDRYLHFPMKGYTLALDIKIEPRIWPILDRIDELVTSYGGKIYLSKDARLKRDDFRRQYAKAAAIPDSKAFQSHQQIRLQEMAEHHFLIIGANSDIARATALAYTKKYPSGKLQLAARDTSTLAQFIHSNKLSGCATAIAVDVENEQSLAAFYQSLPAKPSWVMYAAGVLITNEEAQQHPELYRRNLTVNFTAPVTLLNLIVHDNNPKLERIIGMSSVAGLRGRKSNYAYGSAKAGFHEFLFGLRQDMKGRNVKVQAVTPGFVKTKMTAHLDLPKNANTPEDIANAIMSNTTSFAVYPNLFWRIIGLVVRFAPEFVIKKL